MMTSKTKKETREEISKVFKLFDPDGNGQISVSNLAKVAKDLGENMSEDELREMIEHADKSSNGYVNEEDFYRLMMKGGQSGNSLDDLLDDEP